MWVFLAVISQRNTKTKRRTKPHLHVWWLITAQQSVLHKCSQKSLLFEKLCNCHRAHSRKGIKQHWMIHPFFPREKLTKVYGNIGIFFSRWRLTLQRRRGKWHVNSGEGCIVRRGETVRGVCQRVFVDAAVCGAGRPEGGGHSWGGFALSEEGVQKVTCVWGVQALSGNIKHRSSNPLVTFQQSAAGAICSSGDRGESAHIVECSPRLVSVATRDFIRATKQKVSEVNSTRHLKESPPQNQVLKTPDPA